MKNIWKKQKISITIAFFLAFFFLVVFFLAMPFVARIKGKADDIQKKIIDNQANRERIGKIPQMEEIDREYESKKGKLDVILNIRDQVEFIEKIEALADETGNKMIIKVDETENAGKTQAGKIDAGKKDEKKGIKENLSYDSYISIQINLTGNYPGLVDFIHKLENFNYYVNIISIESKKGVEISEKSTAVPLLPKTANIFAAPVLPPSSQPKEQIKIDRTEKDVINSAINVVIYTKK